MAKADLDRVDIVYIALDVITMVLGAVTGVGCIVYFLIFCRSV